MDWKNLEKIFPFHVFDPETQNSRGDELKLADYIALLKILEMYNPKTILEIGAWTGSCTCLFGNHVKNQGGTVHTIDNFEGSPGSEQAKFAKIACRRFLDNIKPLGDTVVFHEGYSDDFSDLDMKFDMIFIDADHRYSQVIKDIENYYPMVKDGGIICGHDFNSGTYEEKYIEDDYVNGVHHGVTKAVTEKFSDVKLFTSEKEGKLKLVSSVWFSVKKEPCFVTMD